MDSEEDEELIFKRFEWTNKQIFQLVELYKKHECLWNHYHEFYKNKEKRNRAMKLICGTLGITKSEFCKKIHTLRTQFTVHTRKLERNSEEAGADGTTSNWKFFESLIFLRPYIGYKAMGIKVTESKNLRSKFNNNTTNTTNQEEITQYSYENNNTTDFQTFENESSDLSQTTQEICERKFRAPQQQLSVQHRETNKNPLSLSHQTHILTQPLSCSSQPHDIISKNNDSTVIELDPNNLTVDSLNSELVTTSSAIISNGPPAASVLRDQWDVFGELVANEFRNLSSDNSRRRLKRKFMEAMLEIEEEDNHLR